jgi:hypothetical protein
VEPATHTYFGRAFLFLSVLLFLGGLFLTTGERTYWELRGIWWGLAIACLVAGVVLIRLGRK